MTRSHLALLAGALLALSACFVPLSKRIPPQPQPQSQSHPHTHPHTQSVPSLCRPARWTVASATVSDVLPGVESNLRRVRTYRIAADLADFPLHPDSIREWTLLVDSVVLPLSYRREGVQGAWVATRMFYGVPAAGPMLEEERYALHGRELNGMAEVTANTGGGCFRLALPPFEVLPVVAAP